MNFAIVLGMLAVAVYSAFLAVRASIRLYKEGERKLVLYVIAFLVLAPLLIWLSALIPEERTSIWTALPTVILFVIWACFGFFLESFRKNRAKEIEMGVYQKKQPVSRKFWLCNWLMLGLGVVIWLIGTFVGIPHASWEACLLCISLFLIAVGGANLWRSRRI